MYPVQKSNPYLIIRSDVFYPIEITGQMYNVSINQFRTPSRTRTCNLQLRRLLLYPIELLEHYCCACTGTRTQNPMIKSHLLCQLSYKSIISTLSWANKGTRTLNFQFGGLTLCQLSYIRIKIFSCLWGKFYRKKRLVFFRHTWPTNYTIAPY